MTDALDCVDCAETDRLFHSVAAQRDAAVAAVARVRALCDMAAVVQGGGHADAYRTALNDVRAALDAEPTAAPSSLRVSP